MIFKTNQNIFQVNILQNENEVTEWNMFVLNLLGFLLYIVYLSFDCILFF
jgi:hypothetical protein